MVNNQDQSRRRAPYGVWVHRQVFAQAMKVYGAQVANSEELLNLIRRDIVALGISKTPRLSLLTAAQKQQLVNAYFHMQGKRRRDAGPSGGGSQELNRRGRVPANYDPEKRRAPSRPDAIPSVEQREEMTRLFKRLGFPGDSPAAFCKKVCGCRTPPTRAAAGKVLNALRAMERRGWKWGQRPRDEQPTGGGIFTGGDNEGVGNV